MVEIRSNIWGTKFKIHGVDLSLPPLLGQVKHMNTKNSKILPSYFPSKVVTKSTFFFPIYTS